MNIASAIPCGFCEHSPIDRVTANYFGQLIGQREHGGRGRIRTSVARKERQIYSLLVLATHPPVLEKSLRNANRVYLKRLKISSAASENTKRTRVKRHQPVYFDFQDSLRLTPLPNFLVELAEGIEPPTL
jgi:hypothetical protein